MHKDDLKEMLKDMFRDGDITFNTEYDGLIIVEIDEEEVQVIRL